MKQRFSFIGGIALAALVSAGVALAQASRTAAPAAAPLKAGPDVPRAADGKPDLTGVYQPGSRVPGTWEEANQGVGIAVRPAGAPPAPRREGPSYQPWAAKLILDQYNHRNIDSSTARCIPNPTLMNVGLFPVQFVQTPTQVIILIEYMGLFRVVPLNVEHPDDAEPTYLGNSVGHWEGDTLVVDINNFNEDLTAGGGGGRMHSDALHITERYTRTDKNTLRYSYTWDDPKVLTKPDTTNTQFMLRPGTRLREYVCDENNLEPARYEELKKNETLFERK